MKKIVLHRVVQIGAFVLDAGTKIAIGDPKKSKAEAPIVSASTARDLVSTGKAAAIGSPADTSETK